MSLQRAMELAARAHKGGPQNFHQLFDALVEVFQEAFEAELVFCFESEALLPEIQLTHATSEARRLEHSQHFYQFKAFAGAHMNGEVELLKHFPGQILDMHLRSLLLFPFSFVEGRSGIFILANPSFEREEFGKEDLVLLSRIFEVLSDTVESLRLKAIVDLYQHEQQLLERLNRLVDGGIGMQQFHRQLVELVEDTVQCQIVAFLLYSEATGQYMLEAGNAIGCEFYSNQEDFFRSLAIQAESQGIFSRSFSGKHFKGEKYGLDRFETALVMPVSFQEYTHGAFILLNKFQQQSFQELDVRAMNTIIRLSKPVIFREKEKNSLVKRFKRFVADRIVREIMESPERTRFEEERKEISVLFIDLNDFTSFSESTPPARLFHQLNEFLSDMTELVFEYGGTLDKYIGDGVMALFGTPVELENHAELAVECALAMQARMEVLRKKWKKEGKQELSASVGIFSGLAAVGPIGSDRFMDYTAIGDTVNTASRLTSMARPGTILIGQPTFQPLQDVLVVDSERSLTVKGKGQPVNAWEVSALKTEAEIMDLLRLGNSHTRCRILKALGSCTGYKETALPLSWLNDSDVEVRQEAVECIRRMNREIFIEPLIQRLEYETDSDLKQKILGVVSDISSETVVTLLKDYLGDISPDVKSRLVDAIGYQGRDENKKLLLPLLNDSNHEVRANVAHALYRFGDESIIEILLKMMGSQDPGMTIAAVNVLGRIGTTQVVKPLLRAMETNTSNDVRYAVAIALGRQSKIRTIRFLKHFLQSSGLSRDWFTLVLAKEEEPETAAGLYAQVMRSRDLYVLVAALQSLKGESVGVIREVEEEILDLLEYKDDRVQMQALACLRHVSTDRVVPVLLKLYNGGRLEIRREALKELGMRRLSDLASIFVEALKDPDGELEILAVSGLGMIGDLDHLPLLLEKLKHTDNANLKATILRALGGFDSLDVITPLIMGLQSPIGRMRANAIDSLIQRSCTESAGFIRPLLKDENNRVRANAALALFRFGDENIVQSLDEMLQSDDKWMRLSAIWALSEIGDDFSRKIILDHAIDADYDVRLRAIMSLKKMDPNLLSLIQSMMDSHDEGRELEIPGL